MQSAILACPQLLRSNSSQCHLRDIAAFFVPGSCYAVMTAGDGTQDLGAMAPFAIGLQACDMCLLRLACGALRSPNDMGGRDNGWTVRCSGDDATGKSGGRVRVYRGAAVAPGWVFLFCRH